MALLRLPCSPSVPCFSAECYHKVTLSSFFHKPPNQTKHWKNSLLSSSLSQTYSLRTAVKKRISNFVLHFSSTTQDPVIDSSSAVTPAVAVSESNGAEVEQEEYSRTRLFTSNIPWSSTPEDLRSLFEKFGTVVDVELSMFDKTRNRGLAFVAMGSPEEAHAARTNLDLTEYGGRTIRVAYAKYRAKKEKAAPQARTRPLVTFNLFVANLPYDATEKELKEFFAAECPTVVSADFVYHNNPRRPSGYGFVSFKFRKDAEKALSMFPGKLFKGREIRVARSKQFVKPRKKTGSQSDDASTESNSNVEEAVISDENQQSAEHSQSDNNLTASSSAVEEADISDENQQSAEHYQSDNNLTASNSVVEEADTSDENQQSTEHSQSDNNLTASNSAVEEADTSDENQQSAEDSQSDNNLTASNSAVEDADTTNENTKQNAEVS